MKASAFKLSVIVLAVLAVGIACTYSDTKSESAAPKAKKVKPPAKSKDPAFEAFRKKAVVPVVKVPKVAKAPKCDGKMDKAYKKCEPMKFKFITGGGAKPTAATTAYAVSTKKELFIFLTCESPDMDALIKDVRDHDGPIWNDDSIELFIDPTNKRLADGYMHIIVNPLGTVAEAKGPKGAEDYSWNPKLVVKTKETKKAWTVELAIPFKELVPDVRKINRAWAINLNRMAHLIEGDEDTCWSPTGGTDSHVPSKFGVFWLQVGKVDNTKK